MKKIKAARIILMILCAVLCLSFLLLMGTGISTMRDVGHSYTYDAGSYYSDLRGKRYDELLETAQRDTALAKTDHPDVVACRALGQYFRTYVMAVTYEKAGEKSKAGEMRELMDRCMVESAAYANHHEEIRNWVDEAIGGAEDSREAE